MAALHAAVARIPQRALQLVVAAAGLAVIATVALRSRSLPAPLGRLQHPDACWLVVAVVAETASLAAYALLVRKLLRGGIPALAV
jgi:hypothetical protein